MSRIALTATAAALVASAALVAPGAPLSAPSATPAGYSWPVLAKVTPTSGWETGTYTNWYSSSITAAMHSSPAVGDINGDGVPDIVAGFPDGNVFAWAANGNGTPWLRYYTGPGAIHASPTLADLNGDHILDVVTANTYGDVVAFTGTKKLLFSHRTGDGVHQPGDFATPVVADIDRDGKPEIVETSWDHHVHVYNLDGSEVPGFPKFVQDTIWSSPAVADVDGDGWPEIIFGYDCDGVAGQDCYTNYKQRGGYVTVVRHDGRTQPGWPRFVPNQVIWSSPAVTDFDGDGKLDIIVGTGNMPMSGGKEVLGFHANGTNLSGFPVKVGGLTTSSPAIGDVDGDGRNEAVIMGDDDRLYIIGRGGVIKARPCVNGPLDCTTAIERIKSNPVIADVMGTGHPQILVGAQNWLNVVDGAGHLVARGAMFPHAAAPVAAPSVVTYHGQTWIISATSDNLNKRWSLLIWTTGKTLASTPWPTFHQATTRRGVFADLTPPSPALGSVPSSSSTTAVVVPFSASDSGSGVSTFDLQVATDGGAFVGWIGGVKPTSVSGTTASGAARFYGLAGHSYAVRVRARDRAGNISGFTGAKTVAIAAGATKSAPFTDAYAVGAHGGVSAVDSPPAGSPALSGTTARGVAAAAAGGGWVVDGAGVLHRFGAAPALASGATWPGKDVVRGLYVSPNGTWGLVLDRSGALHRLGSAGAVSVSGYWPGSDRARGLVLLRSSTAAHPAGYVLDEFGGLYAFGGAPKAAIGTHWSSDAARAVALNADGSGYVLDRCGGIWSFRGAVKPTGMPYWANSNNARALVVWGSASAPAGVELDAYGGLHGFGTSGIRGTVYASGYQARALAMVP